MAILRPGSKVENRRPVPNPQTVSGYPQWNTYAGLDYISTVKELRIMHGGGGKGVARPPHKLHPDNIAHRIRKGDTHQAMMERAYEQARVLSLQIDRLQGAGLDLAIEKWGKCIRTLIDNRQTVKLADLQRLEAARGQVRVKNALKFAKRV